MIGLSPIRLFTAYLGAQTKSKIVVAALRAAVVAVSRPTVLRVVEPTATATHTVGASFLPYMVHYMP